MKKTIQDLRLEQGISQLELCFAIGVHPGQMSEWENKIRRPRQDRIEKIAAFFEVEPDDLDLAPVRKRNLRRVGYAPRQEVTS